MDGVEEVGTEEVEQVLGLFSSDLWTQSLIMAVVGVAVALGLSVFGRKVLARWAARTNTIIDDVLVEQFQGPFAWSVALLSLMWAVERLHLPEPVPYLNRGVWLSLVVASWTYGGHKVITQLGAQLVKHQDRLAIIQSRTLPLFDMLGRIFLYGLALYFFFLAWRVDLTAWVASAGVVGLALGFAAQETLGNIFAGLAIIADAPFKLGDYLSLENGVRGRVTEIGLRVTRLVTPDDVEIVIPNRVMAGGSVINESGGPYEKTRIRAQVGVAYGSDVAKVKEVLISVARSTELVLREPTPQALFVGFGDSSLDFELYVWASPGRRPAVVDALNCGIDAAFREHGIEIPFPQRDLHFRNPLPKG